MYDSAPLELRISFLCVDEHTFAVKHTTTASDARACVAIGRYRSRGAKYGVYAPRVTLWDVWGQTPDWVEGGPRALEDGTGVRRV